MKNKSYHVISLQSSPIRVMLNKWCGLKAAPLFIVL